MENIMYVVNYVKEKIHSLIADFLINEKILLAVLISLSFMILHYLLTFRFEIIYEHAKENFFNILRKIPYVRNKIINEKRNILKMLQESFNHELKDKIFYQSLPKAKQKPEEIIRKANEYMQLGEFKWKEGNVSGAVYIADEDLLKLETDIYMLTSVCNPLHADIFPGLRIMETEIIRICCDLFHGNELTVGTVTSGGTESILLACLAYRNFAQRAKGIYHPEMIIPRTAHAAFDKAGSLFGIRVVHVNVFDSSMRVSIKSMKKKINKNTCMLVVSAPAFPHGSIDPIVEAAELAHLYNIPLHVDCCLGGFLLPFMKEAGFTVPSFDFSIPGVTSISADTHKYGCAPKGSSVLLYRDSKYRSCQYFVQTDWPGGVYASPTLPGSRPGGLIAACWSALLYHGREGYIKNTKQIISVTRYIVSKLREIPILHIIGEPEVSVIAFGSHHVDIYLLLEYMIKKGWHLNPLQFPPCLHLCVTLNHTLEGVADKFISDCVEVTNQLLKQPNNKSKGSYALYGKAQTISDRSIITEVASLYLDVYYDTGNLNCFQL